ncbi:MAG: glycosyltransferase [Chitinophagaceae bacterium]|nr:glycosyltransferase [Chitinophagaceae bacterium]
MHIAIISNSFQEEYERSLLNSLADKVEKVDFIGPSSYDKESFDKRIRYLDYRGNDNQSSFLGKFFRNVKYYFNLLVYFTTTEATIIHFQWLRFPILDGVMLPLYLKLLGKRIFYTAHNVLPHNKENSFVRFQFRLIYHTMHRIIVHTEYIRGRIQNEFGISPSKLNEVIHGVYERELNPEITREAARKYFKLSSSAVVVLLFGSISKYKGLDILLKSMDSLAKDDLQLLVSGRLDPDYKIEFDALVEKYKSKNIVFVIRRIEDAEVEYCFKAADVTVLPYREASQSGVLFMSYAYGVPVIAPKMGGFVKDIVPEKTGLLFLPNDDKDLAHKIDEFSEHTYFRSLESRANIRNYGLKNYSWSKSAEELKSVYELS